MTPRRSAALALALAATLVTPSVFAATPARLTLVFTGDVGGYLEPCG